MKQHNAYKTLSTVSGVQKILNKHELLSAALANQISWHWETGKARTPPKILHILPPLGISLIPQFPSLFWGQEY